MTGLDLKRIILDAFMNYCVQQIFLLFSDVPSEPQITNLTTVMEIGKPTTVGCVINQVHRLQNGLFMVYISHALKTQLELKYINFLQSEPYMMECSALEFLF